MEFLPSRFSFFLSALLSILLTCAIDTYFSVSLSQSLSTAYTHTHTHTHTQLDYTESNPEENGLYDSKESGTQEARIVKREDEGIGI